MLWSPECHKGNVAHKALVWNKAILVAVEMAVAGPVVAGYSHRQAVWKIEKGALGLVTRIM